MPHLTLDYSANLEDIIDFAALCDVIRRAAIDTGILPMAGVRVRAVRADHVSIADGDPKHGYIDMAVRLRGGREMEAKRIAAAQIFDAAKNYLAPIIATHSIALSLEMRDIDPQLSPKLNTIRNHLNKDNPNV